MFRLSGVFCKTLEALAVAGAFLLENNSKLPKNSKKNDTFSWQSADLGKIHHLDIILDYQCGKKVL